MSGYGCDLTGRYSYLRVYCQVMNHAKCINPGVFRACVCPRGFYSSGD